MIRTDAVVLHSFDYRETSRIVRLATREVGVISVMARGTRRPKASVGPGLDLFTTGAALITIHPTRDLHTLVSFDATRSRPELAGTLPRFGAATMLAELCLRFGSEDVQPALYDLFVSGLESLGRCEGRTAVESGLATGWQLVSELGFAPELDACARCHRPLEPEATTEFAPRAGGLLCADCARVERGGRRLPASARATLQRWLAGERVTLEDLPVERAHQRLLREFVEEHLTDGRPLRAFAAWEAGTA